MANNGVKNPAAVELGKRGAAVTNSKLSAATRQANARKAAKARWAKAPASVLRRRKQAAA